MSPEAEVYAHFIINTADSIISHGFMIPPRSDFEKVSHCPECGMTKEYYRITNEAQHLPDCEIGQLVEYIKTYRKLTNVP